MVRGDDHTARFYNHAGAQRADHLLARPAAELEAGILTEKLLEKRIVHERRDRSASPAHGSWCRCSPPPERPVSPPARRKSVISALVCGTLFLPPAWAGANASEKTIAMIRTYFYSTLLLFDMRPSHKKSSQLAAFLYDLRPRVKYYAAAAGFFALGFRQQASNFGPESLPLADSSRSTNSMIAIGALSP